MNFYSKSKYVRFLGCHNRLWLEENRNEFMEEQKNVQQLINGNKVGDLAMSLFGNYYLAETEDNNIPVMIENTKKAIERNERVICEAAFSYNGCYCAVDILVNTKGEFDLYEVKSTTKVKPSHIYDMAYQYYVLTNLGYKINTCNLVYINNKYEFNESFDLQQYFIIEDLTKQVLDEVKNVESNLLLSDTILNSDIEPETILSNECENYGGCPFKDYCYKRKGIPNENTVLDLYRFKEKFDFANKGIVDYEQLLKTNVSLDFFQTRQIDYALNKSNELYFDKKLVNKFLKDITYPIYFFDFESYQSVIPNLNKTKPYQQIPFQYSLHILYENGELVHKEFLGNGKDDPREKLIIQMINDLGTRGSIIAYNMSFEKTRIKELSCAFPNYNEELENISKRFVDLMIPFTKGYVYNKAMGGSFSIKSVLPALFPNDDKLDYHNLEDVHKGDEASQTYLLLSSLNSEDYNKARKNLLTYCELDTYAMVKIYNLLKEKAKENIL